jgi:hypothetical protein
MLSDPIVGEPIVYPVRDWWLPIFQLPTLQVVVREWEEAWLRLGSNTVTSQADAAVLLPKLQDIKDGLGLGINAVMLRLRRNRDMIARTQSLLTSFQELVYM